MPAPEHPSAPNVARLCSQLGIPMQPRFTPRDAARILGLGERTLFRLIKAGALPVYRPIPNKTWVAAEALEAFLAQGATTTAEGGAT